MRAYLLSPVRLLCLVFAALLGAGCTPTRIEHYYVPETAPAPFIRPARFGPATHEVTIPFTNPAPAESHYDDIFRRAHGTDYDPESPIDRRKMETIKHARLDSREPAATRTF